MLIVPCMAACFCVDPVVNAVDDREAAVRTWLQDELKRAEAFPLDGTRWVEWEMETAIAGGEEGVEQETSRYRLLASGPDHWRLCQEWLPPSRSPVAYLDYGWTEEVAWRLTPDWILIVDPKRPMPAGAPLPVIGNTAFVNMALFFFGGLRIAALEELTLTQVDVDRWGWNARLESADGARRIDFRGRWDAARSRGFVTELRIMKGWAAGATCAFKNWAWNDSLEIWLASSVVFHNPSERRIEARRFISATLAAPDLESCLVIPQPGGVDPIRGTLDPSSMTDHRPADPVHWIKTASGFIMLPESEIIEAEAEHQAMLGRIGPSLAVAIGAGLVLVRVRQSFLRQKEVSHHQEELMT